MGHQVTVKKSLMKLSEVERLNLKVEDASTKDVVRWLACDGSDYLCFHTNCIALAKLKMIPCACLTCNSTFTAAGMPSSPKHVCRPATTRNTPCCPKLFRPCYPFVRSGTLTFLF